MARDRNDRRGLPGGIITPLLVFACFAALFVVGMRSPELIDFGPHFSPAGIGVIGSALTLFCLLAAIGAHRK